MTQKTTLPYLLITYVSDDVAIHLCYLRNNFPMTSDECTVSGETAKLLLHSVTSRYEGCLNKNVF